MSETKLVIFDLDGVLIDSREIHFRALNSALKFHNQQEISWEEHLAKYDGLPTRKKLELLSAEKGLPADLHSVIASTKQTATRSEFKRFNALKYSKLRGYMYDLKDRKIKIAVASNAIRETVQTALHCVGILDLVDYYISNEDVQFNKPYPEMYWKCMKAFKALPRNTVIFEDSHIGRQGALDSGAHLIPILNPDDLTEDKIREAWRFLEGSKRQTVPWRNKKMNVLIPMAGAGSRFEKAGYSFPKPLIEIHGKPMIQVVLENLNIEAHYIFIVQKFHYEKYNLKHLLNMLAPGCDIVQVDGLTEGAACTTLLAKSYIDNDNPLVIANSDQFVDWDSNQCLYAFSAEGVDAGILTFEASHPKWSYARIGPDGFVAEVAEKKVISNHATVGIYYWKRGSDYVRNALRMIEANDRTNGEFYVCPVFNYAIQEGKKVRVKDVVGMWGLGDPESLKYFLENHEDLSYFLQNYKGE